MRALTAAAARIEGARLVLTRQSGDAERMAREAVGCRMVIACGGDGTINEALNGLAGTATPLGVVPMGTANVLALELGIPMDTAGAIDAALSRPPRPIALGRLARDGAVRRFALMAGVGYDARTVHEVRGKRMLGKGAYILSAAMVLVAWRPEPIEISLDGVRHDCYSLIISNARKYAGTFTLAPEADIAEPAFTVTLVEGAGRLDIMRLAWGLASGARGGGIKQVRCREVELHGEAHIQLDGDYHGRGPAIISAEADALRLAY